jgi:primosomal protein N' (replication factor Y)
MLLARVAVPLPLRQTFTYTVPADMRSEVQEGSRVLVPFGRRVLTGVVVGEGDETDATGEGGKRLRLKAIKDVLDDEPALTADLLRLTEWMAQYYRCGWGEVVKAALPAGTDQSSRQHLRLVPGAKLPAEAAQDDYVALVALEKTLRESGEESTALSAFQSSIPEATTSRVRRLVRWGVVALEQRVEEASVRAKLVRHVRLAPAFASASARRDLKQQLRGSKQHAVIDALALFASDGDPFPRQADVVKAAGASAATVKSLAAKGVVETEQKEANRSPFADADPPGPPPKRELHEAQKAALGAITEAIDARRYQAFLLHGVTGSGKTEVYLAALKRTLEQGRGGIILVPEIALTPQTVRRFRAHFGDEIAVLHSKMSLGERYDAWRHLRSGRYRIAIGPRSALFAPVRDLGLIVVDEEHEGSYKQFDPAPRYHARDAALVRASICGAACVLGSATPSLESLLNAERGKYAWLKMPARVPVPGKTAAPLPPVRLVDLTLEKRKHNLHGVLSERLREAIERRLQRKEQVILLQNRRGYAPIVECTDCGFAPTCRDCTATMTYHAPRRELRCHHCGRRQPAPRTCPTCASPDLELLGTGTQRVEEELREVFPEARVVRMDLDTTRRKGAHHELLGRFGRGEADILLGTQMVAKGLDFGAVTLVGVVNADAGLLLPDFRADERTFQLLTQVAGRAGRAEKPGEVLLQTRNPDHAALRYAAQHDYLGFAEAVLPERRDLGWPPFGRVVTASFRGPDEESARRLAQRWTDVLLRQAQGAPVTVLGPTAPYIGRVQKQYRFQTILRMPRSLPQAQWHPWLDAAEAALTLPSAYHFALDVDAISTL